MAEETEAPRAQRPCPICGKPAISEHKPFCSRRCADIDLNRWLSGSYRIPAAADPDEEDERASRTSRDEGEGES
ncbi:MAG: DNA gyrase inhibitor YacG [Bauldia sp.]